MFTSGLKDKGIYIKGILKDTGEATTYKSGGTTCVRFEISQTLSEPVYSPAGTIRGPHEIRPRPAWVAKSLYSTPLLDGSVEFVHDPHCCVARDNSNFGTTRSVPSADCGVARAVCFMGSYAQFMSIPIPKYHSAGPRSGGNRLS